MTYPPRHGPKFVTVLTRGDETTTVSLDFGDFDGCRVFALLMRLGWRWDPDQ